MTLREKAANWLTGGRYVKAKFAEAHLRGYFAPRMWKLENEMMAIRDATHGGKSGTARKIHRLASEALE